jgi:dUTP pyrophosphatase
MVTVKYKLNDPNAQIPVILTKGSAGFDITSVNTSFIIYPNERILIMTGLSLEIPEGYEAQVRPRSGLAYKHGITVLNSPGTLDSDYRGEIGVILINHSDTAFQIRPGDRVAQIVFNKLPEIQLEEVTELSKTDRGSSGFGSTGV